MPLAFHSPSFTLPSPLTILRPHPMASVANASRVVLKRHATQRLPHPQGCTVECQSGCVWITHHDGDTHDVVLTAGGHYHPDCNQRDLVHALEDSHVRILG